MADLYFDDVVLLVARDGADASTVFVDDSLTPHTVAANGDAQYDTAQFIFGSSSIKFDGAGDYLSIPDSGDFAFGGDDFVIEFMVRFNAVPTAGNFASFMGQMTAHINNFSWHVWFDGTYGWCFQVSTADGVSKWGVWGYPEGSTSAVTGVWYHVAAVRNGAIVNLYIDSNKVTTQTDYNYGTNAIYNSSAEVTIGASRYTGGIVYPFNGWLSTIRVTKGTARGYTANGFAPPGDIWMDQFGLVDTASMGELMIGSDTVGTAAEFSGAVDLVAAFRETNIAVAESLAAADGFTSQVVQWFLESIAAQESISTSGVRNLSYADQVAATETLVALFYQLVAESSSASETWYLDTAAMLVDVAVAAGITTSQITAIQALSEIIAALEVQHTGKLEEILESAAGADLIANLVRATQAVLNQAVAADAQASYLILLNTISESALADESISIWQSLNQAIEEGSTAFVHLVVAGEVYTGWVMNTASTAVSEYQGLNFNSMCKIGNRYFGATSAGISELTGAQDSGVDVATYIQSGLLDFGSTQQKAVPDAYLAVDSSGRVALGVSVSEKKQVSTYWYEANRDLEAINNVKVPIGKGLKGRYWKFEIASDAVSEFDAVTVLPVVLARRV